jgi:hypothetical protein
MKKTDVIKFTAGVNFSYAVQTDNTIAKYDHSSSAWTNFGASKQLDLSMGHAGSMYGLSSTGGGQLERLTPGSAGTFVALTGFPSSPAGVAVSTDQDVWLADRIG